MNFKDLLKINRFCASLHSMPDWREVAESIEAGVKDFEVNNVRFIDAEIIDEVLANELRNDDYILGCFNSCFLADVLGIDQDVIDAMQKAESFEAIGKLVKSLDKLDELALAYAKADGYGHHFNSYDSGEEEIVVNGVTYHVFDNR